MLAHCNHVTLCFSVDCTHALFNAVRGMLAQHNHSQSLHTCARTMALDRRKTQQEGGERQWQSQLSFLGPVPPMAHRLVVMQVLVLRLQTAGSIEERVAAVAGSKRTFADRSITGGFFDGHTPSEDRRRYLLELLRAPTPASNHTQLCGSAHIDALLMRGRGDGSPRSPAVAVTTAMTQQHAAGEASADAGAGGGVRTLRSLLHAAPEPPAVRGIGGGASSRLATEAEVAGLVAAAARSVAAPEEVPPEQLGRGKRRRAAAAAAPQQGIGYDARGGIGPGAGQPCPLGERQVSVTGTQLPARRTQQKRRRKDVMGLVSPELCATQALLASPHAAAVPGSNTG